MKDKEWDVVEQMLKLSACVGSREPMTGRTALHLACMGETECPHKVLNLLLSKKADIYSRDQAGWTPLLHATNNSHYTTIGILTRTCTLPHAHNLLTTPSFDNASPVAGALANDDICLCFALCEFLDLNRDAFDKIEI